MIRIMTRILIPNMMLELEKVSSQQNLDSDVEPVTELSMCVRAEEKFEEDFNAFMCRVIFKKSQVLVIMRSLAEEDCSYSSRFENRLRNMPAKKTAFSCQ